MNFDTVKLQLVELEQLLVQPATRLSVEMLNRHLADDFYEIAATGRCFGKADVLERLPTETPPVVMRISAFLIAEEISDLRAARSSPIVGII